MSRDFAFGGCGGYCRVWGLGFRVWGFWGLRGLGSFGWFRVGPKHLNSTSNLVWEIFMIKQLGLGSRESGCPKALRGLGFRV